MVLRKATCIYELTYDETTLRDNLRIATMEANDMGKGVVQSGKPVLSAGGRSDSKTCWPGHRLPPEKLDDPDGG